MERGTRWTTSLLFHRKTTQSLEPVQRLGGTRRQTSRQITPITTGGGPHRRLTYSSVRMKWPVSRVVTVKGGTEGTRVHPRGQPSLVNPPTSCPLNLLIRPEYVPQVRATFRSQPYTPVRTRPITPLPLCSGTHMST